jgi:hypothetical protein
MIVIITRCHSDILSILGVVVLCFLTIENFIANIRWCGIIHDLVPGTEEHLSQSVTAGYIGFNPSAPFFTPWLFGYYYVIKAFPISWAQTHCSSRWCYGNDWRSFRAGARTNIFKRVIMSYEEFVL